jgi:competence protein ComEC
MRNIARNCIVLFIVLLMIPFTALADISATFYDVGQGDAALIQADGKCMLIDAGPDKSAEALLSYLYASGIKKIDILASTHPDEDHIGGMDEVLLEYDVGAIWMSKVSSDTQTYENLILTIQDKGLNITVPEPGTAYKLGDADIAVLPPLNQANEDTNNSSIMLRITYGKTSFLFVGDAETPVEEELLGRENNIDADVLEIGHHGSKTSTSEAFLSAVSPQWAVISCSRDNSYGFPNADTITKLSNAKAVVLRTDTDGTITFLSDGKILQRKITSTGLTNAGSVNVRATASAEAKKVVELKKSAAVSITGSTIASGVLWYQVIASGKTGYIRGDLINILTDEVAAAPAVNPTPKPQKNTVGSSQYIGNKNSRIFHRPSCQTLPAEKNQVNFSSRDAAVNAGYRPCKNCDP